jgi:hypothetical protein
MLLSEGIGKQHGRARRNINLFTVDFMYTLTDKEIDIVVSQNVIPS